MYAPLHEVTVYFNGAMLLHEASIKLAAGETKVTIKGVSIKMDATTLHAFATDNVTILNIFPSTENQEQSVEKPSPKLKMYLDSMESTAFQIQLLNLTIKDLETEKKILEAGPNVSYNGVAINSVEYEKWMKYQEEKRTSINNQMIKLLFKKTALELVNQKVAAIYYDLFSKTNVIQTQDLIVVLNSPKELTTKLSFSYLVSTAGWQPYYDVFIKELDEPLLLNFKGKLFNNSGLNWMNVPLTLSSADPYLSADKPEYTKWTISDYNNSWNPAIYKASYNEPAQINSNGFLFGNQDKIAQKVKRDNYNIKYSLISVPEITQQYFIKNNYSILADSKPYEIAIQATNIKAFYEYYTFPQSNNNAYLIAGIAEWESLSLIDGPASIYIRNAYVGTSALHINSLDDTLKLSLGIDNKISCTRVKLKEESKSAFLGSTQTHSFVYELNIKNNNNAGVWVELNDQLPVSDISDFEIGITNLSGAEKEEATGKITWKIFLASGESKKLTLAYFIKHPKNKKLIANPGRKVMYAPRF